MKKSVLALVLILLLGVLFCSCESENPVDTGTDKTEAQGSLMIVENGVTEFVIVHGENATTAELKAVSEFRKYMDKITGIKIPLVTDAEAPAAKEIVIGKTNREPEGMFDREKLGDDGFVIRTEGDTLYLVGSETRGTLYAVYEFLEAYVGCRFYTEDVEYVPEVTTITVERGIVDEQIPVMLFREVGWVDYFDEDISAKRRVNFNTWGREIPVKYGGVHRYVKSMNGHTFSSLVPPDQYFDEHPEYFMQNKKGVRVPDQLCLTNPDVLGIVIENAKRWIEEDPIGTIISISQNDNPNTCMCKNCIEVYREEGGSFSGTVIRFVNAVAEAIAEDYPDIWVDTFAYQHSQAAPKTAPADNVVVRLCAFAACYSHPHTAGCAGTNVATYLDGTCNSFIEDVQDWSEICENLFIYDYTTDFWHWLMTFPNFDVLRENILFYVENNAIGNISQGNQESRSAEFGELRSYLISKLLWNPYMTEEEYEAHMLDFLVGVYGPGGVYLREYLQLAEDLTEDVCFGIYDPADWLYPATEVNDLNRAAPEDLTAQMLMYHASAIDWNKYATWYYNVSESEIVTKGYELFEKAMEAAETDEQRKQIDKISAQVDYISSYFRYTVIDAKNLKLNISTLVTAIFERDMPELSEDEVSVYYDAAYAAAKDSLTAEYTAFNEALYKHLVKYNISHYHEGWHINECNGNFSKPPSEWQT